MVGMVAVTSIALGCGLGLGLHHGSSSSDGAASTPSVIASPATTAVANANVWQPAVSASWQIILLNGLNVDSSAPSVTPDVGIFDIDMFDHQNNSVVHSLQSLGKKVICYFSAGSYEPSRPDSWKFKSSDLGKELDGWPGERWLNLSSPSVRDIMTSRIQIAKDMGCDAIDPDNVDGYQNKNGLGLSSNDSVDFVTFLASEASKRGMATGLKNAKNIIPQVLPVVQFSVNEQCAQYDECSDFHAFVDAGKPVFHIEYPDGAPKDFDAGTRAKYCAASGTDRFSTVIKDMDLDGWVQYCDGSIATTATTAGDDDDDDDSE